MNTWQPEPCAACDTGRVCTEHGTTWADNWLTPTERKAVDS